MWTSPLPVESRLPLQTFHGLVELFHDHAQDGSAPDGAAEDGAEDRLVEVPVAPVARLLVIGQAREELRSRLIHSGPPSSLRRTAYPRHRAGAPQPRPGRPTSRGPRG